MRRETVRVENEREQRLCFSVYIADMIRNFYRCSVNVWQPSDEVS